MPPWNRQQLVRLVTEEFHGASLVVVSNREPYLHEYATDGSIRVRRSVGGVSISLDSILSATQGLWVAYGGSSADRAAANDRGEIRLPPAQPRYTLKRVWMSAEELDGYYNGFANQTLWPLCHVAFVKPTFRPSDWQAYATINHRFAEETVASLPPGPAVVWLQDYHFALTARSLRQLRPELRIGLFWHIPWPTHQIFRICPWKRQILEGMLANDVLGFHRSYHVRNFLDCIASELEANVDYDEHLVRYKGHTTKVISLAVGIDTGEIDAILEEEKNRNSTIVEKIANKLPSQMLVGIDRIDYTKGIPRRLAAVERFFETYPEYRERVTYVGIGSPSRTAIPAYKTLLDEVLQQVKTVNQRFQTPNWRPIEYFAEFVDRADTALLLRDATVCLVTSLDDGMNLVAKEFVAANRRSGALILSEFTGAAGEFRDALLVNPYDDEAMVARIHEALELPAEERQNRLETMKRHVEEHNLFEWAGEFLTTLAHHTENNESEYKQ